MTCLAALGASLVFALSAGAQTPAANDQGAAAWGPFPPVARALEIRAREGKLPTLRDLLTQLGAASGVAFSTDDVSECRLNDTVLRITSDVTVAAERVYPFVESLLSQHEFFLTVMSTGTPLLIGVHWNGPGPVQRAHFDVPPEHLDFLRVHPALLVQTSLSLPALDVRTLGNSLRALSRDGFSGVLPVANTHDVVLSGTAKSVVDMVDLLLRVQSNCVAGEEQAAAVKRELDASTPPSKR